MGYFISVLRERIANFEAPAGTDNTILLGSQPADASIVTGVSINDLRKNLRDLNEHMERECLSSVARYGITLDASLITGIDPPSEVESALAAINTAHNHVSSDISLAQASADQKIVQSKRAVEIETLNAEAEVEPLNALAAQLGELKRSGADALPAYLRNVRLGLYSRAQQAFLKSVLRIREANNGQFLNGNSSQFYWSTHSDADIRRAGKSLWPLHHCRGGPLPCLRALRQGDSDS
jgi:regulator of protease activity HflC (stomatin/prohibitin superfamily)